MQSVDKMTTEKSAEVARVYNQKIISLLREEHSDVGLQDITKYVEELLPIDKRNSIPDVSELTKDQWTELLSYIQTYPALRVAWYKTLLQCMLDSDYFNTKTMKDVQKHIVFTNEVLGEGGFAKVVRARWGKKGCTVLPIVIKQQELGPQVSEHWCNSYGTELALQGKCMNFLLIFAPIHVPLTSSFVQEYIVMEHATGSLSTWLHQSKRTCREIFSAFFQTMSALYSLAQYYDVVHNDAYLRNVLYNEVKNAKFEYELLRTNNKITKYTLHSSGILVKLADFGLCEGSDAPLHDTLVEARQQNTKIFDGDWTQFFPFTQTAYVEMPRYARDLFAFLSNICHALSKQKTRHAMQMRAYFTEIGDMVSERIMKKESQYLERKEDFMELLHEVVSPKFMGEELAEELDLQSAVVF